MLWLFPLIKTTCPRTQACEGQGLPRDLTNPGVGGEGCGPTLQTRTAGKGARMNDMGRLRGRLDPAPASWACRPLASWEPSRWRASQGPGTHAAVMGGRWPSVCPRVNPAGMSLCPWVSRSH